MQTRICKANKSAIRRPIPQLTLWIVLLVICSSASGLAQTSSAKSAEGHRTFETICASCHGLNGKGGERGPDIATRPEIVRLSDADLLKILHNGKPQGGMPAFSGLGEARLSELLSYLRILQGNRATPTVTANIGNGKEHFSGKGGCTQCHMVQGVGGFIGPDLSDYGARHSPDEIRDAILSADKRLNFRKSLAKATTKDGKEVSGIVRNEDNFSVQLQALDGTFHLLEKSNVSRLTLEPSPLMPNDYGLKLSKTEINELVAYLWSVGNPKQDSPAVTKKKD
jgi:cytochrome c oxidase cbb3-type subunit 3